MVAAFGALRLPVVGPVYRKQLSASRWPTSLGRRVCWQVLLSGPTSAKPAEHFADVAGLSDRASRT
eukprot:14082313-Alexandrium_andersonii.AAC.1